MAFRGKWKHYKDEGLEEFLDVVSAPADMKVTAKEIHPLLEISLEGEYFVACFTDLGPAPDRKVQFKEGEEFDHLASLGDPSKTRRAIATRKSDTNFEIKTVSGEPEITEIREVVGGELVTTLKIGGTVCKRYFKKQE
ncbi:fatty acid-binding protein-like [Glandiceps talaboti]